MFSIDYLGIDLPEINISMLDLHKGLYEYDLIHIPFTNESNHSREFEDLQNLLVDVLHSNYYPLPHYEVEQEFEESIDKELYFNMMLDCKTNKYFFTISTFADKGEVMADIEIGLDDEELQMCMKIAQVHKLIAC